MPGSIFLFCFVLFPPLDIPNKSSTLDYKHNLAAGSPTTMSSKNGEKKQADRCLMPFDTRLRMSGVRPQSSLFNPASPRAVGGPVGSLRKSLDLSSRCSWKCTAILFMLASAVLAAAVAYLTGTDNYPPHITSLTNREKKRRRKTGTKGEEG